MGKITLREFIEKVEDREDIKCRAWADDKEMVDDYDYDRCASSNSSVSDFLANRITPKLQTENGKKIPFEIIDGNYTKPHGSTSMKKLRSSYED